MPDSQQPAASPRLTLTGLTSLVMILVAVGVIAYAISRDQDVTGVRIGDLEVEFAAAGSVASGRIEAEQPELRERVTALDRQARDEGARRPPAAPNTAEFAGDWRGANGLAYRVEQYGTIAVITEQTPWGISAYGQGTINGDTARFAYQAADGSSGQADLRLVDDSTLEGTFTNFMTGITSPASFRRVEP